MQKVLFVEPAELKQGDGLGPKYAAGKAYWLPLDHANRWKAEGVAEDAPAHMAAENERTKEPLAPSDMRIIRLSKHHYDLVHRDGTKFNTAPMNAHEAETMRQKLIAEGRPPEKIPEPASLVVAPMATIISPPPAQAKAVTESAAPNRASGKRQFGPR